MEILMINFLTKDNRIDKTALADLFIKGKGIREEERYFLESQIEALDKAIMFYKKQNGVDIIKYLIFDIKYYETTVTLNGIKLILTDKDSILDIFDSDIDTCAPKIINTFPILENCYDNKRKCFDYDKINSYMILEEITPSDLVKTIYNNDENLIQVLDNGDIVTIESYDFHQTGFLDIVKKGDILGILKP